MFIPHKRDVADLEPWTMLPANQEAIVLGEALYFSSGQLTKAAGTNRPKYISMFTGTVAADGDPIPVIRVQGNVLFETTLAASGAALNVGDKVTIHTDGAQATATTTNGIFEIIEMDGTASGSTVRGYFDVGTGATGAAGADGEDGADGADAPQILITAEAPANDAGAVGDLHINTATGVISTKTAADTWTAAVTFTVGT